jgi:hypothetical protein
VLNLLMIDPTSKVSHAKDINAGDKQELHERLCTVEGGESQDSVKLS